MYSTDILGAWMVVFFTLCIFSYLYDDNPFYKAAEHLFIGVSAGYWAAIYFWTQIQPNLFGRLWPIRNESHDQSMFDSIWYSIYEIFNFINTGFNTLDRSVFPAGGIGNHERRLIYIIPFILGIFMLLRLFPKVGYLARWAIAYIVGMTAGLRFYSFLNSDVIMQIPASTIDFTGNWVDIINGLILFIGTLTGLIYFFFSKEHKGAIGTLSKIGIYFLMIKFGAAFGFTVMGRISLLIGRLNDLTNYSASQYYYATPVLLIVMILLLGFWTFMGTDKNSKQSV